MKKNILVVNQQSSNYGDDAAGSALVSMLLKKVNVEKIDIIYNAEKEIPFTDPRVVHDSDIKFRTAGYLNIISYYLFRRMFRIEPSGEILGRWIHLIRDADVIFVAPSGANIGIYKDWKFLLRVFMVVMENKTPIFHYNTIGKSDCVLFDALARFVLRRSRIYVRERKSEGYIHSLQLNCKFGPDTAFALDTYDYSVRKGVVSFVPSCFAGWHPYFNDNSDDIILKRILSPIAKWIIEHDYQLELLPHLNNEVEKKYNKRVFEMLKKLHLEKIRIRSDINDMWEYDKNISTSEFVIGMRYHTVVLAAKNRRPFLALCYENKMLEVCNYLHCEDLAIDISDTDSLTSERITDTLKYLVDQKEEIITTMEKALKEITQLVHVPTEELI